jgi:HK97 family phage portal protein
MITGQSMIGGITPVGFSQYSSLHNLPTQITDIKTGDLNNPYISYIVNWNLQREWLAEDVLYTKYVTMDECDWLRGLSPLRPGNRLLESSNNLVTADAATLKNRSAGGILTNRAQDIMTETERQQLEDALKGQVGGAEKFNKIIPTSSNVELVPLGLSPKDMEILKSDISKRRRFANIYGFDSGEFNDPQNKTFNSRKEAAKSAFTNVYLPNDNKFVHGLNKWLMPKFMTANNRKLIIEQDVSHVDVLQQDKKLEAEKDKIVMDGVNTVLSMPISKEAKVSLLINEYGFDADRAEIMVKPEGTPNPTLELLKSLSPLLANKLIENLSEEEIREILGK